MKNILLFGVGRSASVLIKNLLNWSRQGKIRATIVDREIKDFIQHRNDNFDVFECDINDLESVNKYILANDIVISLMPPNYHYKIAECCIAYKKHFLTASYLDGQIRNLGEEAKRLGLYFISEMGLDPGIDHLLAKEMIDDIQRKGGQVKSFESYCGGLPSIESDNNPMHYKVTWNPANLISAGKNGARFFNSNSEVFLNHQQVFESFESVDIPNVGKFEMYPNRDSLSYRKLYQLYESEYFIRGTLRYRGYCEAWSELIKLNLTDDQLILTNDELIQIKNKTKNSAVKWLLEGEELSKDEIAAEFLQNIFVKKLYFEDNDKDRVVLFHKIKYEIEGIVDEEHFILDRIGQNKQFTAMSETVSMPLLACVDLILENQFENFGLILPFENQVYKPILKKLREFGVL